jgi:hypothetical protein
MSIADPASTPPVGCDERLAAVASAVALPGARRWFDPAAGEALTDDRNPIDELQRRSIRRGAELMAGRP